MKEIIIEFEDGSKYIVRPNKIGDTVIGGIANDTMIAINKHFNYKPIDWKLRVEFILKRNLL